MQKKNTRIVFLDSLTLGKNSLKERLEAINPHFSYIEYPMTALKETLERCKGAEIILTNKVVLDSGILAELKGTLKLVCITATGMNNVDLEAANKFGIVVKNVAGYSTQSVAQHTLMMALALSAKLPFYDKYCKSGEYAQNPLFTNLSYPLNLIQNKQWGIIGFGNIGQCVAKLASAFGAKVSYFSTSGKNANPSYPRKELEALLKESQIISIHAPLNPSTQNLINAGNLGLLQEGAILINVGRGGIVNEEELAQELKKREICAGFDVFIKEPMVQNHPLLDKEIADKLVLTPHNAWGYEESKEILIDGILKNIAEFVGA
ncbi:D-2-hydroxyacid dehydrogenase [Helicobacter turcicus]|uniref:D-2-hydroxyacid dehydrogenase n=1 Tax=Helicobacter turcicus TaxID=2867412 RepID=A0ABS7JQ05_9HELI|nr:D-2-hydroxyacid dehydrogenase [Helicobacter turcicus]MBX7491447.1 D-2-hydroxyacid dehydrogenase [Helicobacter turcicus]MBX7545907.1 D-2-hydroxyacid dehydrogenase [Helicobacter turcicus]